MNTRTITEKVPCGEATTVEHLDDSGEVVRRDVTVSVERGIFCETGVLASLRRIWKAARDAGRKEWNEH